MIKEGVPLMGKRIRVSMQVDTFTCKTCGNSYNNPFKHTCVLPFGRLASRSIRKGPGKPAR
ncbi:ribosomal protein L37E [Nonomuraea muscovyensis]|uniref:Ribosomal protein L37E n=1 Tax=Nonomuraea muscovyensis TaxID=1124761 RepID=A0A7X0EW28_9ACTN|nr:hypothetical protein [Nonomuraea muscovyensis]MBB6346098.1 ribosomal protein L37E [Nonomuraea muscovyensis]